MMRYTPTIRPLVLTGPSGSGRTVMAFKLITEFPKKFARAVSYTTRQPRRNEIDGVHYYFVSKEKLKSMDQQGEFVTIKKDPASGQCYGTSINEINRIAAVGQAPLLEMGVLQFNELKEKVACNGIYIKPQSLDALRVRLERQTLLSKQQIQSKMALSKIEEEFVRSNHLFAQEDIIVNANLTEAYIRLKARLFQLY